MSTEPKNEHAEPKRENPVEQFDKARAKAEAEVAGKDDGLKRIPETRPPEEVDRRLELGDGVSSGNFEFTKPAAPAPSPLHGTYAGELLRRIRAALEEFEQHVVNDARAAAGEAHDLIADAVNELRGHFHRE